MGRQSLIDDEVVAAAAFALCGEGIAYPVAKDVRQFLARGKRAGEPVGAQGKIQQGLDKWREGRKQALPSETGRPIADALLVELNRALNAATADARNAMQEELRLAKEELSDVAEEAQVLAAQLSDLGDELAARTRERDSMEGQLTAATTEAAELKARVAWEQAALAETQLQLARAQVTTANAGAQCQALSTENARLQAVTDDLRRDADSVRLALGEAIRRADVADARLDAESQARRAAEGRISDLLNAVQSIDVAATRAATAESSTVELRAQVAHLQGLLDRQREVRGFPFWRSRDQRRHGVNEVETDHAA